MGILDSETGHSDLPIALGLPTPGFFGRELLSSGTIYLDVNFIHRLCLYL